MPKQRSYTVSFKCGVIDYHRRNGENVSKTAREYGVDRKRIREWLAMENTLRSSNVGAEAKKRKLHPGGIFSDELDYEVLEYLLEERDAGHSVSNPDLIEKAKEKAQDIDGLENFKASAGWLQKWKKRNKVAIRRGTSESQKVPEDYCPSLQIFKQSVDKLKDRHLYTDFNIMNMDQTMC
jgi:hypothetical protein